MKFKQILFCIFFIFPVFSKAQSVSVRATLQTGMLTDTYFNFIPLRATGAEIVYNKALPYIKFLNYNLGLHYNNSESSNEILALTGLNYVLLSPSGFSHASSSENVTYIKNNWLVSVDLNVYNGVQFADTSLTYVFAGEPSFNISYLIARQLLISGAIGARYSYYPANKHTEDIISACDMVVKLGVVWQFKRKWNKP